MVNSTPIVICLLMGVFLQSFRALAFGVLPNAGATIASFLGTAVNATSPQRKNRKSMAKSRSRASQAPETANNLACTGFLVLLLTLGVLGSGTTAILSGALIVLNFSPAPGLMIDEPQIF